MTLRLVTSVLSNGVYILDWLAIGDRLREEIDLKVVGKLKEAKDRIAKKLKEAAEVEWKGKARIRIPPPIIEIYVEIHRLKKSTKQEKKIDDRKTDNTCHGNHDESSQ